MMSNNKAHTISKILNDMSTPILTYVSSAFLSYYPKLTCLTSATHFIKTIILGEEEEKEILNIKHTNTNSEDDTSSADDTKSDHGQYAQYFAALYGTFVMLAVVKATSSLLKISTIYDKLALANIVYNLFSLSYSLMDSIDQIVYKLAGKSFATCRSKYCIEENDLFINLEIYSPDIISKIDSSEFTRIYLQTDNKTLCENYHEAIEEKFNKSEILCQVIHDNL